MPLVAIFKSLIQRIYYPTVDRIGKVECPLLIVRGMKDEIVPKDHGKRLFDAATGSKLK